MSQKPASTFFVFTLLIVFTFLGGGAGWFIAQHQRAVTTATASGSAERKILFYQSPMHPWITSDKPGKCTICGMSLAPVYEGDETTLAVQGGSDFIKLAESTASVIGVASTPVRTAPLHRTLRVAGVISDDETRHRILSARVPGRIEELHVNQVGVEVINNQPLAVVYSPDVLTAQRLYLENRRLGVSGAVSASEIASSREKLLSFGLVDEDIQKLEQNETPEATLVIRAPFDGTVVSRKAYEGQYVDVNDELFEIGDFSSLWFIFDAYERDLPLLKIGQNVDVTLTSLPGETVTAPIAFIDPNLNESTRTARVRVVLPNSLRRILHRQTANGTVHIESAPTLLIPRSALLYTREHPAAYVDLGGGMYQFRQLTLGHIGDTEAEILDGINEGEKIVTQAALLIDSQSQLAHIATASGTSMEMDQTESPAASAVTLTTPTTLPPELVETVLKITESLASDRLDDYQKHLPAVLEAVHQTKEPVHGILMPFAEKLISGTDLKEARRPFEIFSNAVADIVRTQPKSERQAKIFQCPMSPVLGTARWIQKDNAETRNPFFGSEMLNCGVELH
ncbi:MAG: efflux RND transporter periplasmic adaptor subunit [Planctomycetaceae bacterium]|jgi:Cu(I)/Ag(I) efflux system membrane fusion protein|nr:efflux RND transporter periplasmic adaptor subunit [Planctomycetaceae bacterium]